VNTGLPCETLPERKNQLSSGSYCVKRVKTLARWHDPILLRSFLIHMLPEGRRPFGAEAMKRSVAGRPIALGCDVGMPGEQGPFVIWRRRARSRRSKKTFPAITQSAYAGSEDHEGDPFWLPDSFSWARGAAGIAGCLQQAERSQAPQSNQGRSVQCPVNRIRSRR